MKVKVYVASAFSKNGKGGNKAGVVILDKFKLSVEDKMKISLMVGFAETAFVSKTDKADYKLEYFTPKEEVDLCGHATIATFTILKHLGYVTNKEYKIETKRGILSVELIDDLIMMEQNKPELYEMLSSDEIRACFDLDVLNNMPIQIVSTGLKDIIVPIQNKELLLSMKPNLQTIKNISRKYNTIGIHAFTFDTFNKESSALCRNFAPLYDVDEESATGTSNCALACYLNTYKYIEKENYIFEQGYNYENPSEIDVRIIKDKSIINKVLVGGQGYFDSINEIEI